jgi:hypothetical protein
MCRLMGMFRAEDYGARLRVRNGFIIALTIIPVLLFLFLESPVKMVKAGGIAQALMLPVIGIGTLYLRHRLLLRDIAPARWVTIFLWIATAVIVWLMVVYARDLIGK